VAARPVPAGGGAYPFDQRRPRAGQETKENLMAESAVGSCEGDTRLGGFSLIAADDMEAALEIARGCPSISAGGGVEVGALMDLA